jgi:hypothetical protein
MMIATCAGGWHPSGLPAVRNARGGKRLSDTGNSLRLAGPQTVPRHGIAGRGTMACLADGNLAIVPGEVNLFCLEASVRQGTVDLFAITPEPPPLHGWMQSMTRMHAGLPGGHAACADD